MSTHALNNAKAFQLRFPNHVTT